MEEIMNENKFEVADQKVSVKDRFAGFVDNAKDFIEDHDLPSPDEAAAGHLLHEQIEEMLSTLSDREREVLHFRFGLEDGHSYTLEEVGKKFNVTRERIRQIEAKALRKLRQPSKKLKDFLD